MLKKSENRHKNLFYSTKRNSWTVRSNHSNHKRPACFVIMCFIKLYKCFFFKSDFIRFVCISWYIKRKKTFVFTKKFTCQITEIDKLCLKQQKILLDKNFLVLVLAPAAGMFKPNTWFFLQCMLQLPFIQSLLCPSIYFTVQSTAFIIFQTHSTILWKALCKRSTRWRYQTVFMAFIVEVLFPSGAHKTTRTEVSQICSYSCSDLH